MADYMAMKVEKRINVKEIRYQTTIFLPSTPKAKSWLVVYPCFFHTAVLAKFRRLGFLDYFKSTSALPNNICAYDNSSGKWPVWLDFPRAAEWMEVGEFETDQVRLYILIVIVYYYSIILITINRSILQPYLNGLTTANPPIFY